MINHPPYFPIKLSQNWANGSQKYVPIVWVECLQLIKELTE